MKNTTENNKLLAEFLGWRSAKGIYNKEGRYYDFILPNTIELRCEGEEYYCSDCGRCDYSKTLILNEDLIFHKDWNWLLLVVEKIANTKGFYSVENDLKDLKITSDIQIVYNACVEFVKWYNENN